MLRSSRARPHLIGGEPICPDGPPDWPVHDDDVRLALEAAYQSGHWGRYFGENVERLESDLARLNRCEFALTCSSGTFAVELALRAAGVSVDDEVILAAYDFGGNFLSVIALGAMPVLVDVDPDNWNMSAADLEVAFGPKTRAVLVSHLHGGVAPMREITELARRHGVVVIEDAAQMPGAIIEGRRVGTWGDIGTFSFGGSKLLTAGRGGAIITSSRELHHRARLVCQRASQPFPLSELQAAVLLPQLAKLDIRNDARSFSVARLIGSICDLPGLTPLVNRLPNTAPGFYKLGFQFHSSAVGGLSRGRFVDAVRAEGVALDAGFRALHVNRSTSRYRCVGKLSEAEQAHERMVVLHHPVLLRPESEVDQVARVLAKVHDFADELGEPKPDGSRNRDRSLDN